MRKAVTCAVCLCLTKECADSLLPHVAPGEGCQGEQGQTMARAAPAESHNPERAASWLASVKAQSSQLHVHGAVAFLQFLGRCWPTRCSACLRGAKTLSSSHP